MTSLLQELVTGHAEARPEATAVVDRGEASSYGDLEAAANRLARTLRESGCRRGDRVGLLVPKSFAAIAGTLGVYKSDAILLPLDSGGPASRIAKIIRSCNCRRILAAGSSLAVLRQLVEVSPLPGDISIGWLGKRSEVVGRLPVAFTWEDVASQSPSPVSYRNASDDPAHILYTSGSTGEPKGVVILHSNVLPFVEWARRRYGFGAEDRFSGHSPLLFDLSTFDIFGAFAAGAQLHLVPPELNLVPQRLAQFIRDSELTEWLSVPSALNYMAQVDVVRQGDFPTLRRLFWCGEVFPTPALIHWMTRLPHVGFTNLYGPTETTIASSFYDVPRCPRDERETIPVGRACDGEQLLILDENLGAVAPGAVGELYIAGVGLSPGYWNDPERTSAVLVSRPSGNGHRPDRIYKTGDLARQTEDGLVYLVGRSDSQIKSRGYRIELGEVESAVNSLGLAEETVVTSVATDGFEGRLVCCAYVPRQPRPASPAEIQRELRKLLPHYMLPARWMALDRLPRNGSGKVDRKTLKERFERDESVGARKLAAH